MKISRVLIPFTALLALSIAQNCSAPVPFSTSIIGKSFFKADDCYRPSAQSEIRVFPNVFVYIPTYVTRFFTNTCNEKYVFHFRRDGKDPFVVRFPPLEHPDGFNVQSSEELDEFCKTEQPKAIERYFPVGNTRGKFVNVVREIVKGSLEIRDFGCTENDEGFIIQVPGRAFTNVDIDGIVTYLHGVGYQYNFCAEADE